MTYSDMVNQKTQMAIVPIDEFITLLEIKLDVKERLMDEDPSWNYNIDELKVEINKIKELVA